MAQDPANKSAPTPKHKPSAKHTLHEVLNSLQDVLENELAEDGNSQPPAAARDAAQAPNVLHHARRRDEVLKNLIGAAAAGKPLPATPESPRLDPSEPEGLSVSEDEEFLLEALAPEEPPAGPAEAPPEPESVPEEEFRLQMEDPIAPAAEEEVEPPASAETQADPAAEAPAPQRSRRRRKRPKQIEIGWDDIPILNDIVQPAPELPDIEISPEIRDIAIQVAAALNIELKRAGKETLDVKLVMQLQTLLQRELAARGLLLKEDDAGEEPGASQ
jgi:hypothetical protein